MVSATLIVYIVVALLGAALVGYLIILFNSLVAMKHGFEKAWSNIDVLLKQRNDEITKIAALIKKYIGYEPKVLESVIAARNSCALAREKGDLSQIGQAEGQIRAGLGGVFALAEEYPNLKADQLFEGLRTSINRLEENIADRREFYNESVNIYNVSIAQFPARLFSSMLGFKSADLLKFSEKETADPDLDKLLSA